VPFVKAELTSADQLSVHDKLVEYEACKSSCAYFLNNYGFINDPGLGKIQFKLWPVHLDLLDIVLTNQRIIVLKARQVGVSWLFAGYALWRASFFDGANVLMLSKREDESRALLDKSFYIYQNLPLFLRKKLLKKNESNLLFQDVNIPGVASSGIKAFPSTEDAGRSESASDVICDEWAFHPYAEKNYAAYKPTIDAGGRLVGISTANGVGNFFHRTYTIAKQPDINWSVRNPIGTNGFVPLFVPWYARPGRDQGWYNQQVKEFSDSPYLLAQEYPTSDYDAFISSGNTFFNKDRIHLWMQFTRTPVFSERGGVIKKWKLPVFGEEYVVGVDCAEGRGLDMSGAAIYHYRTMEHVADIHGDLTPDELAAQVVTLAKEYNNAFLNIERNSVGVGVIIDITKRHNYHNVMRYQPVQQQIKLSGRFERNEDFGWPTNAITRPIILRDLAAAISSGSITSYDKSFWEECLSFVNDKGKVQAAEGCRDDRVFKHALAIQAQKHFDSQAVQSEKAQNNLVVRGGI
jgi:hypothetical protein